MCDGLVVSYALGVTSLPIHGDDPLADVVEYGRALSPRVRKLVVERDMVKGMAALGDIS